MIKVLAEKKAGTDKPTEIEGFGYLSLSELVCVNYIHR